ncbi:protein of unknown function [Aminobacter niigataensis]|nr:protein of unknown function [Aminobacter niigataensis]
MPTAPLSEVTDPDPGRPKTGTPTGEIELAQLLHVKQIGASPTLFAAQDTLGMPSRHAMATNRCPVRA